MPDALEQEKVWNSRMGGGAVLRTDRRLDSMVTHLGYRSITLPNQARAQFSSIKTDQRLVREMAERLAMATTVPDNQLTPTQLAHLELARAIAGDCWHTGMVSAAMIPPASDMVSRTAGLYDFGTGAIKIHVDMLNSAQDTVGVMDHELGHHVAFLRTQNQEQASDLTKAHSEAMEFVASRIFKKLGQGEYDEYLKKVTW
jgi:hypothetical protein